MVPEERSSTISAKEVLFIPPPPIPVASVESDFKGEGIRFSSVTEDGELLSRLKAATPFLLVFDLSRWDGSIWTVMPKIEACLGRCKAIVFGKDGDLDMVSGRVAEDVVFLPDVLDAGLLSTALERILRGGWDLFKRRCFIKTPYHLLFCHGPKMEKVKAVIDEIAPTEITPLISGESGTGKELVAHAIHSRSSRRDKPLIKVNCAAVPVSVLEGELFGLEKEAFFGVPRQKPGKLELADEGTLFLDEIGGLDAPLQAKLLRVLRDKEFLRLGGSGSIAAHARLLACTSVNLRTAVEAGRFREDLYNCLSVVHITLPPLRERKEEIRSLVRYFVKLYNFRYGRSYPGLSEQTHALFLRYDWPGNIRELRDIIKRIVVSEDEEAVVREMTMGGADFAAPPFRLRAFCNGAGSLREIGRRAAKEAEKGIILDMLERTHWNRRRTAALLQISYKALLYKIREYGLDR